MEVDEFLSFAGFYSALWFCRTMKKERKYFIDNLTCFVTRVRASGGVDSIRLFALTSQRPQPNPEAPTPFNTQCTFYQGARKPLSKTSSMQEDSLSRGSSVPSTTFTQDLNEIRNERIEAPPMTQESVALSTSSGGTSTSSLSFDSLSCDDLFSINHEALSKRDAGLFEPMASIALDSKNGDDQVEAPPKIKASSTQIDDTLKSSRSSSPRRSKRKQEFLPLFAYSNLQILGCGS